MAAKREREREGEESQMDMSAAPPINGRQPLPAALTPELMMRLQSADVSIPSWTARWPPCSMFGDWVASSRSLSASLDSLRPTRVTAAPAEAKV